MSLQATQVEHQGTGWSQVRLVLFSRTVLFTILAVCGSNWVSTLYLSWNPVYLVTVRHLRLSDPLYLAGITLPYIVGGIGLIVFGGLADYIFRRTGSYRRSYVYLVTALLLVSALCMYLAVSAPSAVESVLFFTLVPISVGIPLLVTIIMGVAPIAHRGAVLGIVVAISTLPAIVAPSVTGLIIQAAGKNAAVGFHNAYLLASLLLLSIGVFFLACVRPGDAHLEEKRERSAVDLHS
jgi:MFS family permease